MAAALREYTPTEAAAVSEIGIKSVHNAIDKRIIGRPSTSPRNRAITDDDLLRLKLWFGVGSILSAERRKRLFAAIDENPEADTVRADDYLIVGVARARSTWPRAAKRSGSGPNRPQRERLGWRRAGLQRHARSGPNSRRDEIARRCHGRDRRGLSRSHCAHGGPRRDLGSGSPARGRPRKLSEQGLKVKSVKRLPLGRASAGKPSGTAS